MGQFVKENAHLHTDKKKFDENFDSIDWSGISTKLIVDEKAAVAMTYIKEALKDLSICEYDELLNKEDE